jgi:hypothetical protein
MKNLFLTLLLLLFGSACLRAQSTHQDSVAKIAHADAKKFKLDDAKLKIFRRDKSNSTSDFFKPAADYNYVTDARLLRDSTYVKAYRQAAYTSTRKRRTLGHYFLIAAPIVLVVAFIIAGAGGAAAGSNL